MKMTPEQKAFYECGKSVESVRETIQKIRQHAIHDGNGPCRENPYRPPEAGRVQGVATPPLRNLPA